MWVCYTVIDYVNDHFPQQQQQTNKKKRNFYKLKNKIFDWEKDYCSHHTHTFIKNQCFCYFLKN